MNGLKVMYIDDYGGVVIACIHKVILNGDRMGVTLCEYVGGGIIRKTELKFYEPVKLTEYADMVSQDIINFYGIQEV